MLQHRPQGSGHLRVCTIAPDMPESLHRVPGGRGAAAVWSALHHMAGNGHRCVGMQWSALWAATRSSVFALFMNQRGRAMYASTEQHVGPYSSTTTLQCVLDMYLVHEEGNQQSRQGVTHGFIQAMCGTGIEPPTLGA